jgi:DNA-binding NarL/FixJ family response regulator
MIRVLVVDDSQAIRQGLRMSLGLEPDLEIVGEAADGLQAVALAGRLAPDVVLMDLAMPALGGLAAVRAVRAAAPATAVVVLTVHDGAEVQRRARRSGAAAFVSKHQGCQGLAAAIRRAAGA